MNEWGRQVRDLIRGADRAALATALAGQASHPYASLVLTGSAMDGSPRTFAAMRVCRSCSMARAGWTMR
jgi:hypothetical protein